MMTVLNCIVVEHDPWLIVLAAIVCIAGSWATVRLFKRTAATRSMEKGAWLVLTALVTGASIWCTHFVAMLGYNPGASVGFDPVLTIVSLLVAMVGAGVGFLIASIGGRSAALVGGATVGLAIVVMHYTGMMGYRVEGIVSWDVRYLVASIVISCTLSAAALLVIRSNDQDRNAHFGTLLLVLAITGLHFTGMTAFIVEPMAIGGSFSNPDALLALALAVAGVALVIVGAGFASSMIDDRARAQAAEALTNMTNGLVMVSSGEKITLFNPRVREIFQLAEHEVFQNMPLASFLGTVGEKAGWNRARTQRLEYGHRSLLGGERTAPLEQEFDDGRVICIACRPLPSGGAILTYEDVTEARAGQKRIAHMAYHDALTGLANRRLFAETIESATAGDAYTLLMIDLDRFKAVNDKLGHTLGDELLVQVARRLRATAEPGDRIFRLGGDEFAILLSEDPERADQLAGQVVNAIAAPFAIGPHIARVGCSVGVAGVLASDDASTAQRRADLALYKAKNDGRGRVALYRDGMIEEAAERRSFEDELSTAVELGQLELHYQPLYGLPEQRLAGFEALVRWKHPERGMISPAHFIPIAEASGAIERIGAWVIDEACRHASLWPDDLYVSVNISAVQLRSPTILSQIHQALTSYSLKPEQLEIEITETAMVDNGDQIAVALAGFRALGVRVAVDDFGTGYSSLAHLREFKVDRIKIDRSFINTVVDDPNAAAVVRAVMGIARELSIATTAEGIETEDQLARLVKLGCGTAQGYLLGRPMELAAASILFDRPGATIIPLRA